MIQEDLEDLVAEFDLKGDRLISPEEFYNMIMAFYELEWLKMNILQFGVK
jgi:hypothetical protein